jgi:hypothetical protein
MTRACAALAGLALACAAHAQGATPDGPPATVGRACALTVVQTDGAPPYGMAFPITVRASAGTGACSSNAEVDAMVARTIADATQWLRARVGREGYRVPGTFPDSTDLWFEFPPVATTGVVSGDSAGAALACAMYSAVSGVPILDDVAMTGAIDADGKVHAVGHIRTKLDGVLAQGLSTMILPAENWWRTETEARQLWSDAVPRIRVVFAADLEDVFFFAFGPYGPQGEQYRRYASALAEATSLLEAGDAERARVSFAEMLAGEPGDSTAQVWREESELRYANTLIEQGLDAVREGRLAAAGLDLERAQDLAPAGEVQSERVLAWCLQGLSAPPPRVGPAPRPLTPDSDAAGSLPVYPAEALPEAPESAGWDAVHPVRADLAGLGAISLAAAAGRGRISLAVSLADASGCVEQDAGRWYAAGDGFVERGREDRVAIALGGAEGLDGAARSALALAGTGGVDAWVFGAGPLRASGHALDLAPRDGPFACDAGTPALLRNEAPSGGAPLGSWDGMLGQGADPCLLWASEANYLSGSPLEGRRSFERRCAECHGEGQPGVQAKVPARVAWEPVGSQAALERFLRDDEAHRERAPEAERGNLVAYLRSAGAPPSWLVAEASGSAGDVVARSAFVDGRWWVVFSRQQVTGFADDTDLTPAQPTYVSVAVRDGARGRMAATPALELVWR